MKRRNLLKSSMATCVAGSGLVSRSMTAADAKTNEARDYYEMRVYTLKEAKLPLLDEYLSKAFIPALGRLGIGPVGVFSEKIGADKMAVYVLIVFKSPDQFSTLSARLTSDTEHQKAGSAYLNTLASDPVYERIDSSIISAIDAMPKLEKLDTKNPRIMNLRIYESHNERAGKKKIEMFNTGELGVFRRAAMPVVFCGETIIGPRMPNLTYMLVFQDDDARKAGWGRFGKDDPDWRKFRSMHEFDDKEIVSKITNKVLTPTDYSQI